MHTTMQSLLVAVGIFAFAAVAQAEKFELQHGPKTPAAEGTLDVKEKKSGNQEVRLETKHIAPPREIAPSLSHIVVWMVPSQTQTPVNVGVLSMNDDRRGELRFDTPYSEFRVLVTAEASRTPTQPSEYVILRGDVRPTFQDKPGKATQKDTQKDPRKQ